MTPPRRAANALNLMEATSKMAPITRKDLSNLGRHCPQLHGPDLVYNRVPSRMADSHEA